MTLDVRDSGPFSGARSFVLGVTSPARAAVGWALSPVASGWNGVVHYDEIQEENNELRSRLAELEGRLAEVPDNEAELEALRQATKVEFVEDIERVSGQVVSDRQTGLERIVEINLGSGDGVQEGMPVVTASGLVGRIVSVSSSHSVVRLLSDQRLSVGVISTRSRIVGVTTGRGGGENLVLDLLGNAADQATARTRFETSGFDSSPYPGGIPVGTLVLSEDGDVQLEPAADIERLSFLTVILYQPQPIGQLDAPIEVPAEEADDEVDSDSETGDGG